MSTEDEIRTRVQACLDSVLEMKENGEMCTLEELVTALWPELDEACAVDLAGYIQEEHIDDSLLRLIAPTEAMVRAVSSFIEQQEHKKGEWLERMSPALEALLEY